MINSQMLKQAAGTMDSKHQHTLQGFVFKVLLQTGKTELGILLIFNAN